MNPSQGFWMYCIIPNQGLMTWDDCRGIHGTSPLITITASNFAAVVSEEPLKKYPLVRDWLIAHQKVNEVVMASGALLPVKFCTIAENKEQIIEEVLKPLASEFQEKFREMEGKEEYGLRVRWKDMDRFFKEMGESEGKIREEKEALLNLSEEHRRNQLIEIGHLVQEAAKKKNREMAAVLLEALSPAAYRVKENPTLGDAMILNTAFLVEKNKQVAFDQAIENLDSKYGSLLYLKYVGPVPPFNFVEIVIHWGKHPSKKLEEKTHGISLR
ncbi:MAG: GvpL/GvpF family gas vesicle protein [Gammaproteobacteria bacterium]|nr:GvpL/GvpF family gas vesicle protein [Gammaproteobacteria bacterium]